MDTMTETRADNTVNYTNITDAKLKLMQKPIYKCYLFGDNFTVVSFVCDENRIPGWFRRQCQRFFLGTKWVKL
jgi:hypothetical protein